MLTDLNWLADGQEYPPKQERDRIKQYEQNESLFLTKHSEVWSEQFTELARQLKKKDLDVDTIINYHQLLSKKTADFVCGEAPTLEYEGGTDDLDKLLRKQRFYAKLYEAIIDVSRYGNGIAKVVNDRLTAVSPKYWFPVVDPADLKQVVHHVIAYPAAQGDDGKPRELYAEIHGIGNVEIRRYNYTVKMGTIGTIGSIIETKGVSATGLSDFAVQPLTNVTHSSSIYGLDDYLIINSIVAKLMWRLHCADTIMDKHSEPSMSGPRSAMSWDDKFKTYYLDLSNYFTRDDSADPDVSYITWNGNLESNFKEIETLLNQLYILSEMGAAFQEASAQGATSSGTALKLRLVSPRIKAQRLVGLNDAPVRTIIHLLAAANGINIDADDLQLKWNDGLPDDPVEDANRRFTETGGKATKSQYSAIKERGLSDEETEAEIDQIRKEAEEAFNPVDDFVNDQGAQDDGAVDKE